MHIQWEWNAPHGADSTGTRKNLSSDQQPFASASLAHAPTHDRAFTHTADQKLLHTCGDVQVATVK